jgi:hypothetical protein
MAVGMSQERLGSSLTPGLLIALPQHPDEHRPQRPVPLGVDQQLVISEAGCYVRIDRLGRQG